MESELFGHVRGAFSGAVSDRRGTLFLDEVGELSLAVQAKLLRVLQSGQNKVDVRVIAATNRNLEEEVRQGRYRADFYHRLSVYPLMVPQLRERGHDILLISGFFLEENRFRLGLLSLCLAPDAQEVLLNYRWPGNVRELEHVIARTALKALAKQPEPPRILTLEAADFDLVNESKALLSTQEVQGQSELDLQNGSSLRDAVSAYERRLISASLARNGGNVASTARELGIDRANLNRTARRLGLK